MIRAKELSELANEPVIEPETVHVTFTVAECGEFHNMGEYHEGIETIEEAMKLYNAIDPIPYAWNPFDWCKYAH